VSATRLVVAGVYVSEGSSCWPGGLSPGTSPASGSFRAARSKRTRRRKTPSSVNGAKSWRSRRRGRFRTRSFAKVHSRSSSSDPGPPRRALARRLRRGPVVRGGRGVSPRDAAGRRAGRRAAPRRGRRRVSRHGRRRHVAAPGRGPGAGPVHRRLGGARARPGREVPKQGLPGRPYLHGLLVATPAGPRAFENLCPHVPIPLDRIHDDIVSADGRTSSARTTRPSSSSRRALRLRAVRRRLAPRDPARPLRGRVGGLAAMSDALLLALFFLCAVASAFSRPPRRRSPPFRTPRSSG